MSEPTAKFTLSSAKKIADAVRKVNDQAVDGTGDPSHRRGYTNREFDALITCYIGAGRNRYRYSWKEVVRSGDDWGVVPNGRSGDACGKNYALNTAEAYNDGQASGDILGNSVDPTIDPEIYVVPVQGNPVVRMRFAPDPYDQDTPLVTFDYPNEKSKNQPPDQTCNCTDTPPDPDPLYCIHTWLAFYDCAADSWGTEVAYQGVHCGPKPLTLGVWQNTLGDPCTAIYLLAAEACPTGGSECATKPADPSPPPGSLSATGCCPTTGATKQCVTTWTSTYVCPNGGGIFGAGGWTPPIAASVCRFPPPTLNTWLPSGDGCTMTYSAVSGPCPTDGSPCPQPPTPPVPSGVPANCCPDSTPPSQFPPLTPYPPFVPPWSTPPVIGVGTNKLPTQPPDKPPGTSTAPKVCVYTFTVHALTPTTWEPVTAPTGGLCKTAPTTLNTWLPSPYDPGRTWVFYKIGDACTSGEDCSNDTVPETPDPPTWPPNMPPTTPGTGTACSCPTTTITYVTGVVCNGDGTMTVTTATATVYAPA